MGMEKIYHDITEAIVSGIEETALNRTREALKQGAAPLDIINEALIPGLEIVGDEYQSGVCFVPELIVAGRIMEGAMKLLDVELRDRAEERPTVGRVMLGSVAGDVHTIGKDLVSTMLNINGFEIVDLGCNVPVSVFVDKVGEVQPDILGLSALLTTTTPQQREVINALTEAGLRERVKVIVGGASTTRAWAEEIGADAYADSASEAVPVCRHLVGAEAV